MNVKKIILGIGLNGNKFMIIVYSLKQNQYTSHGNWNPNFLNSLSNNFKFHE
jgi:hypothetical protein